MVQNQFLAFYQQEKFDYITKSNYQQEMRFIISSLAIICMVNWSAGCSTCGKGGTGVNNAGIIKGGRIYGRGGTGVHNSGMIVGGGGGNKGGDGGGGGNNGGGLLDGLLGSVGGLLNRIVGGGKPPGNDKPDGQKQVCCNGLLSCVVQLLGADCSKNLDLIKFEI